jgi:DNA-binding GntR family transcriptional regulator
MSLVEQGSGDDPEFGLTIDEGFHQIMYEAANNRLLQDYLTTLYALSWRLWRYLSVSQIGLYSRLEELRPIVVALKEADSDLAGDLVEAHIRSYQEHIQAVFLGAVSSTR